MGYPPPAYAEQGTFQGLSKELSYIYRSMFVLFHRFAVVATGRRTDMASIEGYATRPLLATSSNVPGASYLTEAGREGMFVWTGGDLSAAVSADPQQGIYIAPPGSPSGTNGAWVREYDAFLEANWFGAVGDGLANDTPPIQAAIDLAFALGGRNVLIKSGVYRLLARPAPDGAGLACIEMKSRVSLIGDGNERSILRLGDNQINSNTFFRIVMSQNLVQNVSMHDLQIDGNQAQQSGYTNAGNGGAILLGRSQHVTIERVSVQNANGQGIQFSAPVGNPSSDIRITDCLVYNCKGDGNSGIGIQVSQFARLLVTGNIVNSTAGNGIDVYGENNTIVSSGSDFVISGNIVTSSDNGIFPETARNGIVTGNIVRECRSAGIRINRINGAPSLLQIQNNQIDLTPSSLAITGDADQHSGITVQDNFFCNFSGAGGGIVLGGGNGRVSYIVVRNNMFAPATSTVPFVVIVPGTTQAAFIRIYDNHFQGSPNPGFRFVNYADATFLTFVGGWIGLEDINGYDLERLSIATNKLTIQAPAVPAAATSTGSKGEIAYDDSFVYVCVSQSTWKRAPLTTF